MIDEQQGAEVVIVDAAGTEHVFPPGFDPKKAAAIVRQSAGAAPSEPFVAPEKPSTGQMLKNAGKDAVDTFGGLPDALAQVVRHPVDSVTAIPVGILKNLAKIAKDPLGTMYEHPVNTALDVAGADAAMRGVAGLASAPSRIKSARLMSRVDQYMPNKSGYTVADAQAAAQHSASPVQSAVDRYMPNKSAASHAPDPNAAADVSQHAGPRIDPSAYVDVDAHGRTGADMGRDWHAYGSDQERAAADAMERARAQALHRDTGAMDQRYRQLLADDRGFSTVGAMLNPQLRAGAKALMEAAGKQVPKWLPRAGTAVRGGRDAALLAREAPPQPDALQALIAMLTGGG